MSLDDKIPAMTDAQLKALQANASRLAETGAAKQQAEAARLLPLVGAEIDARAAAKAQTLLEKREEKKATQRAKKARASSETA
jgi:hypothetical protein